MGHVDHGKTSILDSIRSSSVAAKEAGGITQAIGASIIPLGTIKTVCGPLLAQVGLTLTIPGLLFIDTPGHAAFVNLRKRGGNLADIAILVVDINDGLKPQTIESIEVLKAYKTPFIIAANKIDTIAGWQKKESNLISEIGAQYPDVLTRFETKLYGIVGQVYEHGLEADRFDRVTDYTKQVAIIPVSAHTKSGIPELLMTLAGLAQRFLEKNLQTNLDDPGTGTILEVKEQKGLGKIMDAIIYGGTLSVGDTIVVGGLSKPVTTKIKGLFEPAPLTEIREKKSKFRPVKSVVASTGVRILAGGVEEVVAGMPLLVADSSNISDVIKKVQEQIEEVLVAQEADGIIIKADSLGSLEALRYLLNEHSIPVKKASIGNISKKDLSDANVIMDKNPLHGIILGFNIPPSEIPPEKIKIITHSVIYKLIEDYDEWKKNTIEASQKNELEKLPNPCKIKLLEGYIFRQNNPAVIGAEVLEGTLRSNSPIMNKDGVYLTQIKGIQLDQKNIDTAEQGKQVAVSMPGVTVGRQIHENDILYSALSEDDFRKYKEHKQFVPDDQKRLLKEISEIMRRDNPVWGI
jgi:translation initiation factor 5B